MESRELRADCSSCFGLCCVVVPFARSSDFPVSKPSGTPCLHLAEDDRCRIHDRLREEGWAGCAAFDCLGAGQHVSRVTYAGRSWREHADLAETAAVLSVVRQLHELLWVVEELDARLGRRGTSYDDVLAVTLGSPADLLALDVDDVRDGLREEIDAGSREIRTPAGPDLAHADLAGADLAGHDLARADLRGALLVGADLTGTDLADADLLGADLRGARVGGARLTGLFLTRSQAGGARGDEATLLPRRIERPEHWSRR